jgi:hypothetical protein
MTNIVADFLKATGWKKFARVDFVHYLNRKGVNISNENVDHILYFSDLVEPTEDGMWRKTK